MAKVDDIYASVLGDLIQPVEGVEDAFAPGSPCDLLYNDAVMARERLCRRLGVEEDDDLELIFDSFCDIMTHLCKVMYRYGAELGNS